jgi:hypothetical protein
MTRDRQGKLARRTRPLTLVASYRPDCWPIASGQNVTCVDAEGYRDAAPWEVDHIAALARAMILAPEAGRGRLYPEDVRWVLAKPGRVTCLIDFLAAVEELADTRTVPLRVNFASSGEVRWQFAPAVRRPMVSPKPRRQGGWRAPRRRSRALRVGTVAGGDGVAEARRATSSVVRRRGSGA